MWKVLIFSDAAAGSLMVLVFFSDTGPREGARRSCGAGVPPTAVASVRL